MSVTETWAPLCMEPDELARWQEMRDRATTHHDRAARPCRDCLVEAAAEMRAVERCNGTPRGDEIMDDENEAPLRDGAKVNAPPALPRDRRVALDVDAPPCGSCAHEPVCGLRVALEGLADVETTAPALPAGLTLALTAVVSCEHFQQDRAKPSAVRPLTSQQRGQANGLDAYRRGPRVTSPETREKMRQAALATAARKRVAG